MQEIYEKCHHFMKNGGKMICIWVVWGFWRYDKCSQFGMAVLRGTLNKVFALDYCSTFANFVETS